MNKLPDCITIPLFVLALLLGLPVLTSCSGKPAASATRQARSEGGRVVTTTRRRCASARVAASASFDSWK